MIQYWLRRPNHYKEHITMKMKGIYISIIQMLSVLLCACQNNNTKQVYPITKVEGEIKWEQIQEIPIDKVLWTEDYGIRAKGQLCYDDENL